jgi:hypothetical protein
VHGGTSTTILVSFGRVKPETGGGC